MDRIPFGIRQLDTTIKGGAPTGSVVLVSGESGAGSREFMYTSTLINGLATGDNQELHDLYYGSRAPEATDPEAVHYVSFTASKEELTQEMRLAMDEEIVDNGFENVVFHEMAERYFHVSPVPRDWYADATHSITDLRKRHERQGLMGALGNRLSEIAPDNLVIIDSLSDLIGAMGEDLEWSDIIYLVQGLRKAAHDWDGLILVHLNHETVTPERYAQLTDATTGAMRFEWESGGSTRARTLVVSQFRGVLSQIEDEDIVRFETEIGDDGFDISDVRKIR
jgi:KaiC/GvpD/RAD55 family RecA-like ATPase